MKNMICIVMTAVIATGILSVSGQNRQQNLHMIGDGHRSITIETPSNTIIKNDDKVITTYFPKPVNQADKKQRANSETHLLSIKPDGIWDIIGILGPNNYMNQVYSFFGDGFEEEVEEGIYNISITMKLYEGTKTTPIVCYLVYDILVDEDVYLTPIADEACYEIHIDAKDENGQSISDHLIIDNYPEVSLSINHGGYYGFDWSWGYVCGEQFPTEWPIRFNNLTASNSISVTQRVSVDTQTTYFINYPLHIGVLNSDLHLSNEPQEMKTYLTYFTISNKEQQHYYNIDYYRYSISSEHELCMPSVIFGWCDGNNYNPNEPIRLITNNKIGDSSLYYEQGYCAVKPFVTAFERLNAQSGSTYQERIASPGIFYTNQEWVFEPIETPPFEFVRLPKSLDYYDPMTPTPMARRISINQPSFFGERTPILYWQAENFNASSSFLGDIYIAGQMEFIGDNGCIRKGDECAILTINADGAEVFKDSLYKYNDEYYNIPFDEPCSVNLEVTNNYLINDGIVKANHTKIDLDLNRDDAMPPTMTVLRVLNEYGQENVYLPNYSNAYIFFAAGDFEPHVFDIDYYDKMQYKGKPEVEVFYAIEGGEWMPFQYIEDETLFHVNYGNVFTINLSQLNTDAANHWIDLKFSLTDEAGNSQVQELRNVFFTGEQVSVSESIGPEHNVYPNPFNEEVHIRTTETINGEVHVNVYSILGEKVYDKTVNCNGESELVIEGSHLESGVYFYDIVAESGKIRGKIIKE